MNKKTVMSMPIGCFRAVIATCVLGIVIGSFRDFEINVALADKTELGASILIAGIAADNINLWLKQVCNIA